MSLSKNSLLYSVATDYNNCLKTNPLVTKSITSGVLGFAGSLVASKLRVYTNFYFKMAKIQRVHKWVNINNVFIC